MPQQVLVRDQVHGRPPTDTFDLPWQDGVPLTPRMLITERVRLEWEGRAEERQTERDAKARGEPLPLVDGAMMKRVNPFQFGRGAAGQVTLKSVTELALEGFGRNAFFLVIDGRQITELDEEIPFKPTSDVTFVRLMRLKGG